MRTRGDSVVLGVILPGRGLGLVGGGVWGGREEGTSNWLGSSCRGAPSRGMLTCIMTSPSSCSACSVVLGADAGLVLGRRLAWAEKEGDGLYAPGAKEAAGVVVEGSRASAKGSRGS